MIPVVDHTEFDRLNAAGRSVVVDFYADWCRPCHALAPELETLATELGDEVEFVKIDVDAEPSLAQELGVFSIPTVVHFSGGAEVARSVGAVRAAQLAERLGLGARTSS